MLAFARQDDDRIVDRAGDVAPGPGEAMVRITRAAAGPSDYRSALRGHGAGVLGSECIGVVEGFGPETASPFPAGSRVAVWPVLSCGTCDMCVSGLPGHCRDGRVLGVNAPGGCFAERVCVPVSNLSRVPDTMDDEQAVFACAVASALQASRATNIADRGYVTVLGESVEALLTAQACVTLNATVRLLGTNEQRVRLCEKWGIKHRLIGDVGRLQDQDAVIVCPSPMGSDADDLVEVATTLAKPRGVIVLAGTHTADAGSLSINKGAVSRIVSGELSVVGSSGGRLIDALIALETGRVSVEPLIEGRARLADGPGVLERIGPDSLRVLIAA